MAALLYLKHAINLSEEELVARWSERGLSPGRSIDDDPLELRRRYGFGTHDASR